jgi:hypothetical protein
MYIIPTTTHSYFIWDITSKFYKVLLLTCKKCIIQNRYQYVYNPSSNKIANVHWISPSNQKLIYISCSHQQCALDVYKSITLTKGSYFSKICYYTQFEDPELSDANVASTLEIYVATMLVL